MSNSISVSMHIGSGKNAINNMDKIKRADLHNNRKYKNNHNEEIDLSLSQYNITLVGTKNIVKDIKDFYKTEFGEALYNYNKKQNREDRKIVDYLEKMNNDTKSNIAVEMIFQIGDKQDWENKTLEDKQKTVDIFKKAIPILQEKNIKCFNASLHLDETSPHLHLLAVPVVENQTRGLEKQVSQNKVITKTTLKDIRTEVEKIFIEEYNKVFNDNKTLKKGCEIEEHLQVQDYKDTKKVLEVAKKVKDKVFLKEAIEQDYKKISSEVKEKEKETKNLTNEVTRLEKKELEIKQEIKKIENDINTQEDIKKELEEKKIVSDELKKEVLKQDFEIQKLTTEKNANDVLLYMHRENIKMVAENIEQAKAEQEKKEKEKEEEEKKLESKRKELAEIIENKKNLDYSLEAELLEKEKEKNKNNEKINRLNAELEEQKEKIENLENNINSNTNQLTELEKKEKEILKEVEVKTETVNQKDKILEVNKMFKYIRNADEYDIYTHFKDFEMFQFLSGGEFKETFIYFLENIKEKNTININVNDEMLKEIKKMNTKYNATLDKGDKKEIVEQLNKVDNKTTNNDEELEKNEDDFELNL